MTGVRAPFEIQLISVCWLLSPVKNKDSTILALEMAPLADSNEPASDGSIGLKEVVCLFPVIGHTEYSEVCFDGRTPSILLQLSSKMQTDVHVSLSAIWATVLSRYTDADTTRFEVFVESATADGEDLRQELATAVDPTAPMTSLLQSKNWESPAERDQDHALHNTKIFILKKPDNDGHTIVAQCSRLTTQVRVLGLGKVPADFPSL
jgi:hypothetical protein